MHYREPATEPVLFPRCPRWSVWWDDRQGGRGRYISYSRDQSDVGQSQGRTVPAPAPASLIYGAPLPDLAPSRHVESGRVTAHFIHLSVRKALRTSAVCYPLSAKQTLDLRHFGYTLFCDWMVPGSLSLKQSTVLLTQSEFECSGPVRSMINSTVLQGHLCKALGAV